MHVCGCVSVTIYVRSCVPASVCVLYVCDFSAVLVGGCVCVCVCVRGWCVTKCLVACYILPL